MIAAAGFWVVVWGPIGLLLAAPITTVLIVLGQHIPQLTFLTVLLGDEPPLSPAQALYHRLLSGDAAAVEDQLTVAIGEAKPAVVTDQIVLPALCMAERDRQLGRFDKVDIAEFEAALDELTEWLVASVEDRRTGDAVGVVRDEKQGVVVVPARGPVDRAAARLTASMLGALVDRPVTTTRASGLLAISSALDSNAVEDIGTLLIVTTGAMAPSHVLLLVRRARRRLPSARVVVCDWSSSDRAKWCDAAGVPGDAQGGQDDVLWVPTIAEAAAVVALARRVQLAARKAIAS
ncbi:MAG: hypothetical protein AB7P22_14495 [Vicinamibacterales bacterium]